MDTRSWWVALGGAWIVPPAFRYVLVDWWLARYVSGAPAADLWQAILWLVVGIVGLMLTAALAARWAGRNPARAGGLTGLLIGGVVYALYGAPAAGVAGARELFPLEAAPPGLALGIFSVSLMRIMSWTYVLAWGMCGGAALAGMSVGLVVGTRQREARNLTPAFFAGQVLLWFLAGLALLGVLVNLALMMTLVHDLGLVDASPFLRWPPVISAALLFFFLLWQLLRRGRRAHQEIQVRRLFNLPGVLTLLSRGLVGGTLAAVLIQCLGLGFWRNLELLAVPFIPLMLRGEPPIHPAYRLAVSNYTVQATWFARSQWVGWGLFLSVLALLVGMVYLWERGAVRRRA